MSPDRSMPWLVALALVVLCAESRRRARPEGRGGTAPGARGKGREGRRPVADLPRAFDDPPKGAKKNGVGPKPDPKAAKTNKDPKKALCRPTR